MQCGFCLKKKKSHYLKREYNRATLQVVFTCQANLNDTFSTPFIRLLGEAQKEATYQTAL